LRNNIYDKLDDLNIPIGQQAKIVDNIILTLVQVKI
jgi:hypothetical protein